MSRPTTVTQKVPTPFGALYAHVSVDHAGTVREVSISTPGKQHDTTMHDALIEIGEAITACLPGAPPGDEPPPARVEAPT